MQSADQTLSEEDLECLLCADVFYEPVTLPCGHTFDKSCLCKLLDRSVQCPLCRSVVHMAPASLKVNLALRNVVKSMFPTSWMNRHQQRKQNIVDLRCKVPLMVLPMVVYPQMPCELRIFEFRYLYMLKKILEGSRRFGIVSSPIVGSIGSTVNVECARQSGQRYYIDCKGEKRFRIKKIHFINLVDNLDPQFEQELDTLKPDSVVRAKGYYVADVEWLVEEDTSNNGYDSDDVYISSEMAALTHTVNDYFKARPNRLMYAITRFGPMPPSSNAQDYSYWVASAIPIPLLFKQQLLAESSTRERLHMLNNLTTKYIIKGQADMRFFKRIVFIVLAILVGIYLYYSNKQEGHSVVP